MLLLTLLLSQITFANTAEYEGTASYSWHLDPPSLWIDGDAAAKIKEDLRLHAKERKMTVTVSCTEYEGQPTACLIEFPSK